MSDNDTPRTVPDDPIDLAGDLTPSPDRGSEPRQDDRADANVDSGDVPDAQTVAAADANYIGADTARSSGDQRRPEDADEQSVRSVPLDTEDGGTVVIEQQNVGPDNQVGGGEFKNAAGHKTPDQAADEQADLEKEAAINAGGDTVGGD